ncbi:MAG: hypothetical protein GX772_12305 [Alcaligenaceae bacterium]|nr:hypothetical protein [Alcaligenaceae bacterium]
MNAFHPPDALIHVPLYVIAHSRSGDKGNTSNLSLIAYQPEGYDVLVGQVTEERLLQWFAARSPTRVTRYLLPQLHALNFVLEGVLDGGVNSALNLDAHGKSLSFFLLDMPLQLPAHMLERVSGISHPEQYVTKVDGPDAVHA